MEAEQRYEAKRQMIALMQAGHPWHKAAAIAGLHIGRSAAYQLLRNVHLRGEAALQDGRHGHPAKLRPPVREFLENTCPEAPHTPSHVVQATLQEQFGLLVSIGHLNRVRDELAWAADPALEGAFDLVLAFECVHDMARPVEALRAMRSLVAKGGAVIIADKWVADTFTAPGDDVERYMYGFSALHCLPVGMVDPPSAETGTVMRPQTLRGYASDADFSTVEILPVAFDFWHFYRLVP